MHFKFDSNLLKFGKFLITIPTLQMPEKTIGIQATVSHVLHAPPSVRPQRGSKRIPDHRYACTAHAPTSLIRKRRHVYENTQLRMHVLGGRPVRIIYCKVCDGLLIVFMLKIKLDPRGKTAPEHCA